MHMVRPTRASCIGISQQRRASFRDGNSVTSAQENSIKIKEEFVNLLAGEEVLSGRRVLARQRIRLGYRVFYSLTEVEKPIGKPRP